MIDVAWDSDRKNIIVWKFSESWDFDKFYQMQKEVDRMIDTADGYVDSIFLTSIQQNIPASGLTHLRRIISNQHPRHRYTVIVGSRAFLSSLLKLLGQLLPNFSSNLLFARTQDEAYALLKLKRDKVIL